MHFELVDFLNMLLNTFFLIYLFFTEPKQEPSKELPKDK